MRRLLCLVIAAALCVCTTACKEETVAGIWIPLEPSDYYFELAQDGTCTMFENDEWVSSGNYTVFEGGVEFRTDTGNFTWVWDERSDVMLFEAGDTTYHFRLREPHDGS